MEIEVEELHKRLLEMAKAFHKICENNNIKYYMLGGTMLGAVRHKGFIPWDDDMDFGIPRSDYNKFLLLTKESFPDEYELRFYKNTPESPMHYVKFVDNRTTLIERGYKNYIEGLYLDVFPLDGVKSYSLLEKARIRKILSIQYMIMNHCSTIERNNCIKKAFKWFCEKQSVSRLHNILEHLMIKDDLSESELIGNLLGAWAQKEIMQKSIMGTPVLYQFEDTMFYGSEDADGYLKSLYGNYMQLPPKEKQVFKHNYYLLDYNIPFRDYQKDIKNDLM